MFAKIKLAYDIVLIASTTAMVARGAHGIYRDLADCLKTYAEIED